MTEVVVDSLNPEFVTEILVDFKFEEQQKMLVQVYDADDGTSLFDLTKQDFIGEYEFSLGKLVNCRDQELKGELQNQNSNTRKTPGQVKIMANEKKSDQGKQ